MTKLWHILKPEQKLGLAKLYRELAGFEFVPPDRPARTIQCEPKLEGLAEIDKLMRQKPGGRVA